MSRTIRPLLALAALAASSAVADAADAGGAANTIGGALGTAINDAVAPVIVLISMVSFGAGLWLLAKGLMRLKNVPAERAEAGPAVLAIVAAVLLIAMPELAGVGVTTIFGDNSFFGNADLQTMSRGLDLDGGNTASSTATSAVGKVIGSTTAAAPTACLNLSSASGTSDSDNAVTCMAKNLALNAVPIGVLAIFVVGFLGGLVTFASCILELTKGEREQRSQGLWPKLILSVLLMNAIYLFMFSSNTLLGSGNTTISSTGLDTSSSLLKYTSTSSAATFQAYADLIGYCFYILAFFGVFAFVRGIYMLKNASEGKGQNTYGSGMTFMVAGILLANAKYTSCMILTTVAGSSAAATGFCS